jgi:hypothetical protein
MVISEKDYNERFDAYLKEQGPNPADTFFGAWGWYATKKNAFNAMLREDGITVIYDRDPQTDIS